MGKFSITECPYCGGKEIEIRQRISGIGCTYVDLETGEIDESRIYDSLNCTNIGKYVKCSICGKRLNITVEEVENYLLNQQTKKYLIESPKPNTLDHPDFRSLNGIESVFNMKNFLVLEQKSIDKTELFDILQDTESMQALAKYLKVKDSYEHVKWIMCTSKGMDLSKIFSQLKNIDQIESFLLYEIISVLMKNKPDLEKLTKESGVSWLFSKEIINDKQCEKLTGETAFYLDKLLRKMNQKLQEKNITVIIIYDGLDKIILPEQRSKLLSALVGMWDRYYWSLKNVQAKIFLDQDIYEREVIVTDKVKLKNHMAILR